jgi:DNA end-binding protein Ku
MPQAIWKGHISFGLVSIPVTLHPAEARNDIDLDLLDKRDFSRIGYQKINKRTGRPVPREAIVRGLQYKNGRYVVLSDEDLRRASPERTQQVDILAFVNPDDIPATFYDRPYYLAPVPKTEKPYALLRDALKQTAKVGLATVVIRTRQHLAALIPQGRVLVLNVLRYADELRDVDALKLPGTDAKSLRISPQESKMARRLVEEMVDVWDPKKYEDEYRRELLAFARKKAERGDTEESEEQAAPPAERKAEIVDIMDLLKRSLEEKSPRRRQRRRGRKTRAA